jgi:hypothetical protein
MGDGGTITEETADDGGAPPSQSRITSGNYKTEKGGRRHNTIQYNTTQHTTQYTRSVKVATVAHAEMETEYAGDISEGEIQLSPKRHSQPGRGRAICRRRSRSPSNHTRRSPVRYVRLLNPPLSSAADTADARFMKKKLHTMERAMLRLSEEHRKDLESARAVHRQAEAFHIRMEVVIQNNIDATRMAAEMLASDRVDSSSSVRDFEQKLERLMKPTSL